MLPFAKRKDVNKENNSSINKKLRLQLKRYNIKQKVSEIVESGIV